MTAGKWCYHPWTGNPVDHDFNTKKWCVTVTLQNIKKSTSSLRSTWACPKLGHPEIEWDIIVFLIEMSIFGLPSFQDKPISPYISTIHGKTLMFDTQLGKNTWPHASPLVPNKACSSKDPNSIPIGTVFFGQGARLFLESGFLFLTEVLWRLGIHWLLGGRYSVAPQTWYELTMAQSQL